MSLRRSASVVRRPTSINKTAAFNRCLRLGEQNLSAGRLRAAYNLLLRAAHFARGSNLKSQGRQLESKVNDAGREALDQAEQQYEQGQYVEALRAYNDLSKMSKLDAATQAKVRLAEARRDPSVRIHMRDARAARLFEKIEELQSRLSRSCQGDPNPSAEFDEEVALTLLEGQAPDCAGCEDCRAWAELTPDQREARILADRLEMVSALEKIVTKYGKTPTGIKSARLLRAMLTDDQFAAEVDRERIQQEARRTYTWAMAYAQTGVNDKAALMLRKLLDHYSETQWAEEARADLKKNKELASLVAQTASIASGSDLTSTSQLREQADEIVARAAAQAPDTIEAADGSLEGNAYRRLVQLIGPSLVNATRRTIPTTSLAKKQRVLLYYSASWCGPCNSFTPKLKAFYEANKTENNFEIVLVSSDATSEDMYRYMSNHKMPWLSVPMKRLQSSGLIDEYAVEGIPHLVLIDQNGLVLSNSVVNGRYVGPDNVLSYLKAKTEMATRRDT